MPRTIVLLLLASLAFGARAESPAGGAYADKLGLQLYSLHEELDADLPGTLAQIAGIGIENVEIYGLLGRTPQQFKAELDHAGLKAVGYQVQLAHLQSGVPDIIAAARELGIGHVGVAADAFNKACPALKDAGLHVFYHLHGFEFRRDGTGRTLLDRFLAKTDPACVELQVDVFGRPRPARIRSLCCAAIRTGSSFCI